MRNDGLRYAFFFAPRQLCANRRMANEPFAAPSNERARHRGAIADENLHAFQRILAIMNEDQIRRIENPTASSAYAITDGRGKDGMFDWERLERNAANLHGRTFFDQTMLFDGIMS